MFSIFLCPKNNFVHFAVLIEFIKNAAAICPISKITKSAFSLHPNIQYGYVKSYQIGHNDKYEYVIVKCK